MSDEVGNKRFPSKRLKAEISNVGSSNIGRFVNTKTAVDDDTKINLINNHWKQDPDFDFPLSHVGSAHRKFNIYVGWISGPGYVIQSSMTVLFVFLVFCLVLKLDIMAQNLQNYSKNS